MTQLKKNRDVPAYEREFKFTKREFAFLAEVIYNHTGIMLKKEKYEMVYARLSRRIRKLGFDSFKDYCQLLESEVGDSEIGNLTNSITTNMTKFFRDKSQFSHLRHSVIKPKVLGASSTKKETLRIWSAGCSTGEEAYSIAMTAKASFPKRQKWDVRILATDIDTKVLNTAKAGLYANKGMENVPNELFERFFTYSDDENTLIIDKALKNMISFKELNLLGSWPMRQSFDAIFCKNVMIYFDQKTSEALVERFVDLLVPGGVLYLGNSEALLGNNKNLERDGHSVYRKIR